MNVIQKRPFIQEIKRLNKQQRVEFEAALKQIIDDPAIGELKTANLTGIRVHKFRMNWQLALLAYSHDELSDTLNLMMLGSHENFYRNLKNKD